MRLSAMNASADHRDASGCNNKEGIFNLYDRLDAGTIDILDFRRLVRPSDCYAFLDAIRKVGKEMPNNELGDKAFTYLILSISGQYQ